MGQRQSRIARCSNPQAWPEIFRAVGEIRHLVEDAAQPAHVRNQA